VKHHIRKERVAMAKFGKWFNDEGDEEFNQMLEESSKKAKDSLKSGLIFGAIALALMGAGVLIAALTSDDSSNSDSDNKD
jgi:hypothetical protein